MIGLGMILVSLVATAVLYPTLPAQVPTHWNAQGQIDDYNPKWALFLLGPGIQAAILCSFAILPWLSPRNFSLDTFRATYEYIVIVILLSWTYFYALGLWAAMTGRVQPGKAVWGGVCLLSALLANVLGKVRRNFWIGVRTPWTLANERVWNATHRFAAKLGMGTSLASFILGFLGTKFWIPVSVLLAGVLIPMFYSLVYYKQLERRGEI